MVARDPSVRARRRSARAGLPATPNALGTITAMPDDQTVQSWVRRNEAARAEDRRRDLQRSMSERLEEAVRLSRVAAELEANMGREPDVRT
jgi:hypothetical protein